jgi:hypothetical protein
MKYTLSILIGILPLAGTAFAQQRPLATEDPECIGGGRVLIDGGVDYGRDQFFPASGLTGHLLRVPLIGVAVGLSSIAQLEIAGGFHNRLTITERRAAPLADMLDVTGGTTTDVEDVVVGTKIRVVAEAAGRPAFGVRFATRLPNARNESGLGLDTTDFLATVLAAKTVQSIRVVGNVGVGILGDPIRGDRQNDVLLLGLSVARAMTSEIELVGEVNGRANTRSGPAPVGTESRGTMRLGARYTRGALRLDSAMLVGMTTRDPSIGITAGFTYVFNAFRVP